ncbi:MAG: Na+/H+ antiporter subunit E [Proteobacteria bacterium]|nr:Na+/H+ antiporter subunit E [Pseudomonadota bacterium]
MARVIRVKVRFSPLEGGRILLHVLSLGLVLFLLWLLLSGFFATLLLSLGVVSVAFVVWIAHRMDVIDHEGHPIHLTLRALFYWPWLIVEIIKANIDVAGAIVRRRMPVNPSVIEVKATQETELGQVIYANSITLTPGTVTIDIDKDIMIVHALTRNAAEDLESGEMDRRVTALEAHPSAEGLPRPPPPGGQSK